RTWWPAPTAASPPRPRTGRRSTRRSSGPSSSRWPRAPAGPPPGSGASRLGLSEERGQERRELGRRLLGHMVTAVDGLASHVVGPVTPDGERVAVEVSHVVPSGPQEQQRAADPAARGAVRLVVLAVDAQPGAVVLHHRVHGVRVADRPQVVLVGLGAHVLGGGGVPGFRVGADEPLGWLVRLAE